MTDCTQCLRNKAEGTLWENMTRDIDSPNWVDGEVPLCHRCADVAMEGHRRKFEGIIVEFRQFRPSSTERK